MSNAYDAFLGGRLHLHQTGYKATNDAVFVAAAVPARTGQRILDVGSGTGAVSLCLAARIPGVVLTGVDIDSDMVVCAQENAEINHIPAQWIRGSVQNAGLLKGEQFDHIVTNPPYFSNSPLRQKYAQTAHTDVPLSTWLDFCLKRLRPRGTLTLIHRTECIPEILDCLQDRLGRLTVFPLWPKQGEPAKRCLVQGVLGSKQPFMLSAGLVMHDSHGFTAEAERIMREGAFLPLRPQTEPDFKLSTLTTSATK